MKVRMIGYDAWMGVFHDREKRRLYVCPLPCVVLQFDGVGNFMGVCVSILYWIVLAIAVGCLTHA